VNETLVFYSNLTPSVSISTNPSISIPHLASASISQDPNDETSFVLLINNSRLYHLSYDFSSFASTELPPHYFLNKIIHQVKFHPFSPSTVMVLSSSGIEAFHVSLASPFRSLDSWPFGPEILVHCPVSFDFGSNRPSCIWELFSIFFTCANANTYVISPCVPVSSKITEMDYQKLYGAIMQLKNESSTSSSVSYLDSSQLDLSLRWLEESFAPLSGEETGWRRLESPQSQYISAAIQGPFKLEPHFVLNRHLGDSPRTEPMILHLQVQPGSMIHSPTLTLVVNDGRLVSITSLERVLPRWGRRARGPTASSSTLPCLPWGQADEAANSLSQTGQTSGLSHTKYVARIASSSASSVNGTQPHHLSTGTAGSSDRKKKQTNDSALWVVVQASIVEMASDDLLRSVLSPEACPGALLLISNRSVFLVSNDGWVNRTQSLLSGSSSSGNFHPVDAGAGALSGSLICCVCQGKSADSTAIRGVVYRSASGETASEASDAVLVWLSNHQMERHLVSSLVPLSPSKGDAPSTSNAGSKHPSSKIKSESDEFLSSTPFSDVLAPSYSSLVSYIAGGRKEVSPDLQPLEALVAVSTRISEEAGVLRTVHARTIARAETIVQTSVKAKDSLDSMSTDLTSIQQSFDRIDQKSTILLSLAQNITLRANVIVETLKKCESFLSIEEQKAIESLQLYSAEISGPVSSMLSDLLQQADEVSARTSTQFPSSHLMYSAPHRMQLRQIQTQLGNAQTQIDAMKKKLMERAN
jgi:hypothetical protein